MSTIYELLYWLYCEVEGNTVVAITWILARIARYSAKTHVWSSQALRGIIARYTTRVESERNRTP
jgi:hypothetical protein